MHGDVKYRKSIKIASNIVLGIGIGFFWRYRYFEINPIPDTSSTRYRFRPISNASDTTTLGGFPLNNRHIQVKVSSELVKVNTWLEISKLSLNVILHIKSSIFN